MKKPMPNVLDPTQPSLYRLPTPSFPESPPSSVPLFTGTGPESIPLPYSGAIRQVENRKYFSKLAFFLGNSCIWRF